MGVCLRVISRVILSAMVLGLPSVELRGQATKTMLALPPAPLLPTTLGKLTRVAEGDSGDGLGNVDAEDGIILKEDGLKRFARSEYTENGKPIPGNGSRNDPTQHGTVTVYKFGDVSGAVAAFDYFRNPRAGKSVPHKLGDAAGFDSQGVVFRSGVNVVREDLNRDGNDAVMLELIGKLPKVGGPAALAPLLPTYLPAKSLQKESVRYALGPAGYTATGGVLPSEIVGFDKAAEVVTAKYEGKGTLTLLLYPTPQIAGDHGRQIVAEMSKAGPSAGTVLLRREGPLVSMTSGMWSGPEAKALVEGIHLRNELTWNKPMPLEFHSEVRKTVSLLTSILIFCGLGAIAAVVLALFFGGARAAIRVMQGKPAATEPEFLRIDLSGRPSPIHSDGSGAKTWRRR